MTAPDGFLAPPLREARWLEPWWDGVSRGELCLPRCSACGTWQWYPLESGPCCAGAEFDWVTISPRATVFSFTEVRKPLLPGVKEPYVTGLVVPDDAPGCRIPGLLVAPPGIEVRIGAGARFTVAHTGDGDVPYFTIEVQP